MSTLKSSREIDAVFREARRSAHPLLILLAARTPDGRGPEGRVAFVAGRRIGGAVVRNRAKRVMRAAVRRVGGPWAGYDVVLIARPATGQAASEDLERALLGLLRRAGLAG